MTELVPLVDLTGDVASVAADFDAACRRTGFLSIAGHGVPDDLVGAALEAADRFFALSVEEKLRYRPPSAEVNRGYASKGAEALALSLDVETPPDLFEAFNLGPEHVDEADPAVAVERHRFFAPNVWPELPGFREALVPYFEAAAGLARRLTRVAAVALGLDEGFFADKTDHSTDTLRVNWYRRDEGAPPPAPGQQRMGAHTDYGILTVLYADPVPGLEIVGPDGAWHGVVPQPGTFLVNLGDLLAEWTNDRWRSTLHRVVPPPSAASGPALRRSMAFFHDGNHDALVEVLPTCTSADDPPRYPPVRAGEHLLAKLLGPRTASKSGAALSTVGDRTSALP